VDRGGSDALAPAAGGSAPARDQEDWGPAMSYKPRIKLVVVTENGISESEIKEPYVTATMYEAAHELIYTMSTGKLKPRRRLRKGN
jgi:hypothetical protein